MTDLNDLVEPLKRELAVPGTFATVFPNTQDTDLVGSLEDGFGQAQLVGFLTTSELDFTTHVVTPDLSPAAKALIILFAADRILTMRLLEMKSRVAYEAGPVKYETEQAASMMTEVLKGLRARRKEILDAATGVGRSSGGFAMGDMYGAKMHTVISGGNPYDFYLHELAG